MNNEKDHKNPTAIKCDCCNEEISPSDALTTEGKDYVYRFCGMQCYDVWKKTKANGDKKK